MPPLVEVPVGGYTDVTGIVNATAAAEIVVEFAKLKALILEGSGSSSPSPDYYQINSEIARKLNAEIDGLAAAIAAAPAA